MVVSWIRILVVFAAVTTHVAIAQNVQFEEGYDAYQRPNLAKGDSSPDVISVNMEILDVFSIKAGVLETRVKIVDIWTDHRITMKDDGTKQQKVSISGNIWAP
jgi:hypothetical protein